MEQNCLKESKEEQETFFCKWKCGVSSLNLQEIIVHQEKNHMQQKTEYICPVSAKHGSFKRYRFLMKHLKEEHPSQYKKERSKYLRKYNNNNNQKSKISSSEDSSEEEKQKPTKKIFILN